MREKQRSVFTRIVGIQLVSVCISLLIVGVIFGWLLQKYYFGVREWNLIEQGHRIVGMLQEDVIDNDTGIMRDRIYTLAESSDVDLWIIGTEGRIIAGSRLEQEDVTLTLEEAEVDHVLAGNNITKKVMGPYYQNLLVVQPIYHTDPERSSETVGALAMRAPLGGVGDTINNVMRLIIIAGLVAGMVVTVISLSMAKGFAKPLEQLKQATIDIAHNKFRQVSIAPHSLEVDLLVDAFNYTSQQIEQTTREQKRLTKIRTDFLSDLSHELRAPLTSIKGFLELLEHRIPPEKHEKYRRIMLKDTEYLERLVNDVLELSKMESGYFSLQKEWVGINKLINEALETLELQFAEKKVAVVKELADHLPDIYVDTQRIHQVMINLLINALQFTNKNSGITIQSYQAKQNIVLEVSDQGPGIDRDNLPYIWERFYKSDKARTRKNHGSGLGLAIVKQIVQAHNGTISVDSIPNQGTTFKLTFPLSKEVPN